MHECLLEGLNLLIQWLCGVRALHPQELEPGVQCLFRHPIFLDHLEPVISNLWHVAPNDHAWHTSGHQIEQKKKLRPFADFCARFADFLRPVCGLGFDVFSRFSSWRHECCIFLYPDASWCHAWHAWSWRMQHMHDPDVLCMILTFYAWSWRLWSWRFACMHDILTCMIMPWRLMIHMILTLDDPDGYAWSWRAILMASWCVSCMY